MSKEKTIDRLEISINGKFLNLYIEGVAFDDTELIDRMLSDHVAFLEVLDGREVKCITHHPEGRVDYRVKRKETE
jgi:hypothetical protein